MIVALIALTLVIAVLLYERRSERHEWASERSELLTRIQAPEVVIEKQIAAGRPELQLVPYDPGVPYDGSMGDPA